MRVAVLALSQGGRNLAEKITAGLTEGRTLATGGSITAALRDNWQHYDGFVCIMAAGIVVRAIAPLLADKRTDPAVVVLDELGTHAVSLLSGHLGGGNDLARRIAAITGGSPVITTASDTLGLVPLDLWAKAQRLVPATGTTLTRASSLLVNRGSLRVYCEIEVEDLPGGLEQVEEREEGDLLVSCRRPGPDELVLHPRTLVVGIGCNRGTPLEEFEEALAELLDRHDLAAAAIRNLASIDAKKDEEQLLQFAARHGWPIDFFARETINEVGGTAVSAAALKAVGAIGVAEPTALLSARTTQLQIRKEKWQNITMAVAQAPFTLSARVREHSNI